MVIGGAEAAAAVTVACAEEMDVRCGRADGNLVILGRIEACNRGVFRVLHAGQ